MSYRKPTNESDARLWNAWIDTHRASLRSFGVPPEVYVDREHWREFLEVGDVCRYRDVYTGFEFSDLSPMQMRALLRFLQSQEHFGAAGSNLAGWLQHRIADA